MMFRNKSKYISIIIGVKQQYFKIFFIDLKYLCVLNPNLDWPYRGNERHGIT